MFALHRRVESTPAAQNIARRPTLLNHSGPVRGRIHVASSPRSRRAETTPVIQGPATSSSPRTCRSRRRVEPGDAAPPSADPAAAVRGQGRRRNGTRVERRIDVRSRARRPPRPGDGRPGAGHGGIGEATGRAAGREGRGAGRGHRRRPRRRSTRPPSRPSSATPASCTARSTSDRCPPPHGVGSTRRCGSFQGCGAWSRRATRSPTTSSRWRRRCLGWAGCSTWWRPAVTAALAQEVDGPHGLGPPAQRAPGRVGARPRSDPTRRAR